MEHGAKTGVGGRLPTVVGTQGKKQWCSALRC